MSIKRIISSSLILLIIIALPFAVIFARNQTSTRSDASNRSTTSTRPVQLKFSPTQKTVNPKSSINVRVSLDPNRNSIQSVDFTVTYPTDLVELIGIIDERSYIRNTIPKSSQIQGIYKFKGSTTRRYRFFTRTPLVTLRFKAKSDGVAKILFSTVEIKSGNTNSGSVTVEKNESTITIGKGSASVTPSPAITIPPQTTITPQPTDTDPTPGITVPPESTPIPTSSVTTPTPIESGPTITGTATIEPSPNIIACDFDGNGSVDRPDFDIWLDEMRKISEDTRSDCDDDGKVTIFDYVKWLDEYRKMNNN